MNYMQTELYLSDCPWDVEIDSLSQDSYDWDVRPPRRQICKTIGDCYTVYHIKKEKKNY